MGVQRDYHEVEVRRAEEGDAWRVGEEEEEDKRGKKMIDSGEEGKWEKEKREKSLKER